MARRSNISDPSALCTQLLASVQALPHDLQSKSPRDRIKALVPIHHLLRDIGSSVMPAEISARSARDRILAYLKNNVLQVVHGDELMVVSGISEYARRVRELRIEHGWPIITGNTLKDMSKDDPSSVEGLPLLRTDDYFLLSLERDATAVARWALAKDIRKEKISTTEKILKYLKAYVGQPVTGEELKYLVKGKEWTRRARELRTDHGWSVVTKATGRPDLPVGSYLLEDLRQAPEHDRDIKDDVRMAVLQRDGYKCIDCKWSREMLHADDPRHHLEIHHVLMHAKGGGNTADNLVTLCNVCHDVRHRADK